MANQVNETTPSNELTMYLRYTRLYDFCVLSLAIVVGVFITLSIPAHRSDLRLVTFAMLLLFIVTHLYAMHVERMRIKEQAFNAENTNGQPVMTQPVKNGHWLANHLELASYMVLALCIIDIIVFIFVLATPLNKDTTALNILLTILLGTAVLIIIFETSENNIKANNRDTRED